MPELVHPERLQDLQILIQIRVQVKHKYVSVLVLLTFVVLLSR